MPQAHFTDRVLPSLFRQAQKEGKRLDFWDTGFTRSGSRRRGFGLRITAQGRGTWFVRYKIRGRHQRRSLGKAPGMSLSQARDVAGEILDLVEQGLDPDVEQLRRRKVVTFNELADSYIHYIRTKPKPIKTWRSRERILEKDLRPAFGPIPANEITRADFRHVLRKIVDRGSHVQANRTQAVLSAMYNYGLDHEDLLAEVMEYNPLQRLKKLGHETPADRSLSWPEISALWPHWESYSEHSKKRHGSPSGKVIMMGLLTGQRLSEVLGMRWRELEKVDELGGRWWEIPGDVSQNGVFIPGRTKNGKPHRVYLAPRAAQIVDSMKSKGLPYVFPSPKRENSPMGDARRAIASSSQISRVKDWSFKTLRTTWATLSSEAGTDPWLISEVLNHTPDGIAGTGARVTAVHYVQSKHRHADKKRAAMTQFADRLTLELGESRSTVLAFSG